MSDNNWELLNELRVVGEGPSAVTVGVKKVVYSEEELEKFNIDHGIAQNSTLSQVQVQVSSSLYQEYALVDKVQRGVEGEGPIGDLKKAIGELVLLQSLTSALRENITYTVKDTFSDETSYNMKLPLIQEIEIMQSINSKAGNSMEKRLHSMRKTVTKRRRFEQDILFFKRQCPDWKFLVVDNRKRQIAERPELSTYQLDRDILAIDCFWRCRPSLFKDPYFFSYLCMDPEDGNLQLDPLYNYSSQTLQQIVMTLQITVTDTCRQQNIASLDLWQLLQSQDARNNLVEKFSTTPHLMDVFLRCEALRHTSLAREIFQKIAEEVSKGATIVTTMTNNTAFNPSSVDCSEIKLSEQFSLCQHSNRILSWQVAETLVFTIALVPLNLDRLTTTTLNTDNTNLNHMDVDPVADSLNGHWQDITTKMFVTMLATFHALIVVQQEREEIERQWRHRSGEAERQVIVRKHATVVTAKATSTIATPQSMLVDAFKVLRVHHQVLRLQRILDSAQGNFVQTLISTGLISSRGALSIDLVREKFLTEGLKEKQDHTPQDVMTWWQHHISPLQSFEYVISLRFLVPSSFKINSTVGKPESTASSSLAVRNDTMECKMVLRSSDGGSLDTDCVKLFVQQGESIDREGNSVAMSNISSALFQEILCKLLRFSIYTNWAALVSAKWSLSSFPTSHRLVYSFCRSFGSSSSLSPLAIQLEDRIAEVRISLLQKKLQEPNFVVALTFSINQQPSTMVQDITLSNIAELFLPGIIGKQSSALSYKDIMEQYDVVEGSMDSVQDLNITWLWSHL